MMVLHAALIAREFYLWGETSVPAPALSGKGRRRGSTLPALPHGAAKDMLVTALAEGVASVRADGKALAMRTVWLPTVRGQPLASSPLIAVLPEASEPAALAPWSVIALRVDPPALVELLAAALDRETLGPGLVVGKDLAYWANALRFASAITVRQQFLPGLAKSDDRWRACWDAVFTGGDADRLAKLARAMPHACRALSENATRPPTTPSVAVLTAFVNEVVDHLARSARAAPPPQKGKTGFDSLHDQWLHALGSADGRMEGDEDEAAKLAAQIREWRRSINVTAAAPVKLCFRLEEPADAISLGAPSPSERAAERAQEPLTPSRLKAGHDPWRVRFLLQPADDPSLLIEAAEVWKRRSDKAASLIRDGFNPKEYLLSALGQASGICPRIEASLQTAAPAGYELDAAGAHEFLTEKAWGLEQGGFTVLLPAWWTGKGTKLRLSARAGVKSSKMQATSGLTLDEIIKFDWEIALGDATLTLAELKALANLKTPLVKIRGQWVQLNAAELQAAIDLWERKATRQGSARDVIQLALGATPALSGIAFEGVRAEGWIAELLAQLEGRAAFEEQAVPAGLRGELRAYQKRGFSWLSFLRRWGLGACLADDMGLGKTIQVLTLVQREWEAGSRVPMLLICPTSVTGNWQKEAARFTPELPVLVHHGTERTKGAAFAKAASQCALVVSSFPLLHRDFDLFKAVPWGGVVLDEAQNIKNPETKQAKAARALRADCRIALTGTPVENNVGDLWSIMEFLNPGFLGTQSEFKRRFFLPIQVDRNPHATERLRRLTGPFILRRVKTDRNIIADLPDKLEMKVFCPLTKEQASLYAAVVEEAGEALEDASGIQRKGLVLATLMKLKQVCNHPAHFLGDNSSIPGRSGKLARLTEMLEEVLAEGDRALVFTQFTEMGELLRRHLQEMFGREVLFLHGAVPRTSRDRMVDRFQTAADAPPVFLLSLKAGGTGLNLTRANHVFHFDRWWNPAVENQATDRAFRIGQTRHVQVHKFLCQGTLEEKIDDMIERKKEVAANVVSAGEGWLTELSTAELKNLFALRAEAVQE
jgi:SNF2 family DNA or RNA helicase